MAGPFSRLIAALTDQVAGVKGESAQEWGSASPSSRKAIRNSVRVGLPGLRDDDIDSLLDTSQVPRPYDWSLSISHTQDFGGWIAVPRPAQIGWDVELKGRLKTSHIKRISTDDEINQAPNPLFIWSAKEAFFKALEDDQPITVTQLTVGSWRSIGPELWSWQGFGSRNGIGLLLESGAWTMGTCLIR